MLMLHAAVDANDRLRVVLSEHGVVLYEDSARLPHMPTALHYASALRLLADSLTNFQADELRKADERAQRRGEAR